MTSKRAKIYRVAEFFALLLLLIALVGGLVFWHPMGWVCSLVVAVVLYATGILVIAKRLRRSVSEKEAIAGMDNLFQAEKEPPKNWYFLP